jgi:predicted phage replisome organizer/uncharacterized phage protein (TIGR02220 family)
LADVKWIKITTNMFEDEKIDFIESLPESDAILVIWIKLLTLAGKCNAGGFIFLTEKIPYTTEMLAHKFRRPINTVKLALETLVRLEMIEFENEGFIKVSKWSKHQNIEGLDRIREQTRLRVAKHRENQKLLTECNVKSNVTVTQRNAIDIEEDKDIDIKIYSPVIEYLNSKCNTKYRTTAKKTKDLINARTNEGFTLEEFKKVIDNKSAEWLGTEFEKFLRPETLFGTKFESYLNQKNITPKQQGKPNKFHNFIQSDENQDLEAMARKRFEKRVSEIKTKQEDE